MRDVNPFDYWESHSSAIEGLGGLERSPDPRYLFHTRYHEVRAGRARFVLTLKGVRASFGELSVRVHAWKPESDGNVSLVSGARMLLYGQDGAELTLPVHFAPQKGVRYALYGYFSEASDIIAKTLQVAIDEPEETGESPPEPPRSALAMDRPSQEARPANSLLHHGRTEIEHPVSQSCTVDQVAALGLSTRFFGRDCVDDSDPAITQWSETLCLNALTAYGATYPGLEGLVVGPVSVDFTTHLPPSAALTRLVGGSPAGPSNDFFDFLLMPSDIEAVTKAHPNARKRWEAIEDWLALLKIGGLAAFGLRYRADSDLVSSSAVPKTEALSRNEIGQWALRLIGRGYSVAPMAFAPLSRLIVDGRGLAAFVMIVQRL